MWFTLVPTVIGKHSTTLCIGATEPRDLFELGKLSADLHKHGLHFQIHDCSVEQHPTGAEEKGITLTVDLNDCNKTQGEGA